MNIIEAILDKRIFGQLPVLKKLETTANWRVLPKVLFVLYIENEAVA